MATVECLTSINTSHIAEVLEVANSILRRHSNDELSCRKLRLESYLEMNPVHRGADYREIVQTALSDLTAAVHLHLNREEQAATPVFNLGA
jgi:hypothetical protein